MTSAELGTRQQQGFTFPGSTGPGLMSRGWWRALVPRLTAESNVGELRSLLTEEDRRQLELLLVADPRRGQVIERTGGFRKLRFARPSRREGKSGGTRVIYYFIQRKDRIYLIDVYAKGVKDDLTRAEENALRQIARALERE